MIRIQSEQQLIDAFREIDRADVQLPRDLTFPFLLKDYLAWIEPSGHRTYLLFNDEDSRNLLGVVFKRAQEPADTPVKMCEWCHSVRGGGRVAMLSVKVDQNKLIGLHLCRDLSCKEKINELPGVNDLTESKDRSLRTRLLNERIKRFLRSKLF